MEVIRIFSEIIAQDFPFYIIRNSLPRRMDGKASKKASKKTSKKKRSAPAHSAIQVEVIKMICERDGIKYPQGMKKLKEYGKKANGFEHEKGGDYIAYLKKTKEWLKKN